MRESDIFQNLFVLELANNHWGRLDRGLKIIRDFGQVSRFNGVRAALKLQFRDVDAFIHKDFRERTDIRYVKKTVDTAMGWDCYRQMVEAVRSWSMVTMATPFDEVSVDKCVEFGVQIIKIASSDIKDWALIEKIAATRKPTIMSTGGSSLKDVDDVVAFFNKRRIPLAVNHCVSIYPSEDGELELNQIDFLRQRYPDNVIGFSTHECRDWTSSIMIAYAKGAQTFERHVDIDADGIPVSPYCSLPEQIDVWFRAFKKAQEMCGGASTAKRVPPEKEIRYLDALVRGVYARRPLKAGERIGTDNVYFAIPLQQGQISCRELVSGEVLRADVPADGPILLDAIESPFGEGSLLSQTIARRGIPAG